LDLGPRRRSVDASVVAVTRADSHGFYRRGSSVSGAASSSDADADGATAAKPKAATSAASRRRHRGSGGSIRAVYDGLARLFHTKSRRSSASAASTSASDVLESAQSGSRVSGQGRGERSRSARASGGTEEELGVSAAAARRTASDRAITAQYRSRCVIAPAAKSRVYACVCMRACVRVCARLCVISCLHLAGGAHMFPRVGFHDSLSTSSDDSGEIPVPASLFTGGRFGGASRVTTTPEARTQPQPAASAPATPSHLIVELKNA